MQTLVSLAGDLAAGRTSSRELVAQCLDRAAAGEGARVFLEVLAVQANTVADACDRLRQAGVALPRFAGIPISVKDLFDLAGQTTRAGSVILRDAAPAPQDATVIARLRAAGFVIIGRTNMTEFAFSGVGLNPHYGTPLNPWDRATGRIPGGSSSGAAVSVTDKMSAAAIGTDTGGSCRIPAALCGLVGFKPTARRIPKDGTYPLSTTLDSIGPLARSVSCCALLDAVMADQNPESLPQQNYDLRRLRLGVLSSYVTENMDTHVADSYSRALQTLSAAGASLSDVPVPELSQLPDLNRNGGISAAEALAHHRDNLDAHGERYDPRVASRILRAREMSAADYVSLLTQRAAFVRSVGSRLSGFDAVLMPTTPIVAPPVAELGPDEGYWRINGLMLRNTSVVNMLDGCAISLPCHDPDTAPVGLSLFAVQNADRQLLAAAAAVESCLRRRAGAQPAAVS